MTFKIPKYFQNHPAIKECEDAKKNGFEGYKYDILLNDGWQFTNWTSITMGVFHSIEDFKHANPQKI